MAEGLSQRVQGLAVRQCHNEHDEQHHRYDHAQRHIFFEGCLLAGGRRDSRDASIAPPGGPGPYELRRTRFG